METDETAIGGKVKNMSNRKRKERKEAGIGRGTDAKTLQEFVTGRTEETATVHTGEAGACKGVDRAHGSVNHSAHEYVRGDVRTNGVEAPWSLIKRGYHGTFHHISDQHLGGYVAEFEGRNNIRDMDMIDQLAFLAFGIVGKRIKYDDLAGKVGAAA